MQYLLIINIGPVQEFIASARRSQDLWFGSWLLSELSKTAAKTIVEKESIDSLIFPAPNDLKDLEQDSSFDVANKIVAIIATEPKDLTLRIFAAVKTRLNEIKEKAFKEINGLFNKEVANKQIEDMLELFWVAKLMDKNYHQIRKEAEALMAARKVTRNYANVSWGSNVPKSSLDGQRESILPKQDKYNPESLQRKYHINQGEQLCGVGLLKRFGKRKEGVHFYSTSHIASLPFIKLFNEKSKISLEKYINKLLSLGGKAEDFSYSLSNTKIDFDGHILYEERLSDYFDKNEKASLEKAKEGLQDFYKECDKLFHAKKRPSPYYGLLLADGDRMGEAIDHQNTLEGHQKISKALTEFAGSVKKIVEQDYNGCLVYAGGDDVLAFLPVNTILNCARSLAENFRKKLKEFPTKSASPTLSVGIAIVHHLQPLSESLDLVRKAEKTAKNVSGKNALAITVSKRSGTDLTIKGNWDNLDNRLQEWIAMHFNGQIPEGVAYELRDLAFILTNNKQMSNEDTFEDLVKKQVKRILIRKRVNRGSQPIDESTMDNILEMMSSFKNNKKGLSLREISDEIIVARIFADAKKIAVQQIEGEK